VIVHFIKNIPAIHVRKHDVMDDVWCSSRIKDIFCFIVVVMGDQKTINASSIVGLGNINNSSKYAFWGHKVSCICNKLIRTLYVVMEGWFDRHDGFILNTTKGIRNAGITTVMSCKSRAT
jgi:hypothetical protein